ARLHERLQDMLDGDDIQIADFLTEVCADLSICFSTVGAPGVELEVQIQSGRMKPRAALALGLIVNELVPNAGKHGAGKRLIQISLRRDRMGWRLTVRDNGGGMTEDALARSGLGMRLLRDLANQLGGTLRLDPATQGTSVSVFWN